MVSSTTAPRALQFLVSNTRLVGEQACRNASIVVSPSLISSHGFLGDQRVGTTIAGNEDRPSTCPPVSDLSVGFCERARLS